MRNLLLALVLGISSLSALAQTKPMVKDFGAELPRSTIYIGNSFFTTTTAYIRKLGNL